MSRVVKTSAAVILSLPILAVFLLFDLMKLPLMLFFVFPLCGLMDLIRVLRGGDAMLPRAIPFLLLMGVDAWWKGILDMPEPRWINPFR